MKVKEIVKNVVTAGAFVGMYKICDHYIPKSTNPIVALGLAIVKVAISVGASKEIGEAAADYIPEKKKRMKWTEYYAKKPEKSLGEEISESIRTRVSKRAHEIVDGIFGEEKKPSIKYNEKKARVNDYNIRTFSTTCKSMEEANNFVTCLENTLLCYGYISIEDAKKTAGRTDIFNKDQDFGWTEGTFEPDVSEVETSFGTIFYVTLGEVKPLCEKWV